ncbi:MAG: Flp pilus assembly protein CpaB [Anaerolineae bacterium]|nr:Flp pilus assembly protein CpaB [Anaerolineae bacterium]
MNRRRTFLIVFIVLILILVVGIGALLLLRGGLPGGGEQPPPQVDGGVPTPTPEVITERVVVALQTIPRGMRIPPDAVEIREWPINDPAFPFPEDPIYNLEDVVGMTARVEIPMHRPVNASKVKVVFQGEGSEFSLAVPKGRVAYAIPVKALSTVANALQPGDRVDVLISFLVVDVEQNLQSKLPVAWIGDPEVCMEAGCQATGEQIPRLVSQYTVQNALVLGVGMWTEPDITVVAPSAQETEGQTDTAVTQVIEGDGEAAAPAAQNLAVQLTDIRVITLVVDPQDALVLKWVLESNASIDLVMRSAIDQDIYSTEAVTLKYMLDRFAISLPPKLATVPENEFKYNIIDTMLEYQQSTAQPQQ